MIYAVESRSLFGVNIWADVRGVVTHGTNCGSMANSNDLYEMAGPIPFRMAAFDRFLAGMQGNFAIYFTGSCDPGKVTIIEAIFDNPDDVVRFKERYRFIRQLGNPSVKASPDG